MRWRWSEHKHKTQILASLYVSRKIHELTLNGSSNPSFLAMAGPQGPVVMTTFLASKFPLLVLTVTTLPPGMTSVTW